MCMVEAAWRAEPADGSLGTEQVPDEMPRQSSAHVSHTGQSLGVCFAAVEVTVASNGQISYLYCGSHDEMPNNGMVWMMSKASTYVG